MNAIDRDTLVRLAGRAEWPSASIYLPLDHTGSHTDADRIRLRNLAKKACERLVVDGLKESAADAMVAPVLAIASDDTAWKGGPSGLAIFATPQGVEALWVDVTMPELSIVGDRFYIRPLFAAYAGEKKAWALALDSNKTRLFHLDSATIEEVELPAGTPVSLTEIKAAEEHEESLQFQTLPGATAEGAHGQNAAMFHGHAGDRDFDKVARDRFMQHLSHGVVETIGAESSEMLVLLGVDFMVQGFREATHYAHIAGEQVEGATDYLSPADVHRTVIAALAARTRSAGTADVDEYRELAGTGRTSNDPAEIVAAAAGGRVKTLIMDDSAGPWGYFDRATFETAQLCEVEPRFLRDTMDASDDVDMLECGWDLIDLAAAETVRHGGMVRAFRGEDAPIQGAVAVFRY